MPNYDFIVDVEGKRLVSSFLSTRSTRPGDAVFGDTASVDVRLVEPNSNNASQPWRYVDLTGYSIRVAIGNPGGDPESGNFTLTFGADTTVAIDAASTTLAADIDTALNNLASITTAGGVTVAAVSAGFQVTFDTVGAQALITATTDGLFPSSSAYIYEVLAGDGSTAEIQTITLEVDNAAYVELTTDIAAPTATITEVRTGVTDTVSELQRIQISGDPYLGTYQITIAGEQTEPLGVGSSLTEIGAAISALTSIGAGLATATGNSLDYTVAFDSSLGNIGTATVDTTNLSGSIGKTGSLDLNVNGFLELLGGAAAVNSTLEIVKYNTGSSSSETVLQQAITCRQDVIPDSPASETPFPSYAASSHSHTVSDLTDLASSDVMLTTDTNLTGYGFFIDDDTMAADDAEKVASQSSIKNYVDTQISGLGSVMEFKGSYDANTTDPTDGGIGDSYVVTVAGTGVASFWSTALEIGDLIIQENDPATTEADWVVVSKDFDLSLYQLKPTEGAFVDGDKTKLDAIEAAADVTDEVNVTAALDGATLTAATVAGTDKVLIQDTDGSDELKTATAQSIADLAGAGTANELATTGAAVDVSAAAPPSTGQVLKATSATTATWQAEAGGGLADIVDDASPQLGADLDTNGNAIVTVSNADIELTPNGTGSILQTAYSTTQRNGNFSTAGDAQAVNYVLRCQSTNDTSEEMFLDGSSARMVLSADSTWTFKGSVVARRASTQESASYEFSGTIHYNDENDVAELLSAVTPTVIDEDDATWALTVTADDTNNSLKLSVVGGASSGSINWVAYVQTVQTTNITTYY